MNGDICISHTRNSIIITGKSDKYNLDESRIECEENLRAKHSALSVKDSNTSKKTYPYLTQNYRIASSHENQTC